MQAEVFGSHARAADGEFPGREMGDNDVWICMNYQMYSSGHRFGSISLMDSVGIDRFECATLMYIRSLHNGHFDHDQEIIVICRTV